MKPVLVAALLVAFFGLAGAEPRQIPGSPPPPPAPGAAAAGVGTAIVRGRVLRPDGRPLARATVRLLAGDRAVRGVDTEMDGSFEFSGVPAGEFRVAASGTGYIAFEFGQQRFGDRGRPIVVTDGDTKEHIDVVLPRQGVIAGRVVDENGDPLEAANVRVFESRFSNGRRRLVPIGTVGGRTNDLGRYRVFGLQPGRYFLSATVGEIRMSGPPADMPGYAPTYFPGTPNPAEAQPVSVGLSQEVVGVDFSIVPTRTARIAGIAFNVDGAPVTGGLQLVPAHRSGAGATASGARIDPDGSFEFPNVAAGDYVIQAFKGRRSSWNEGDFGWMPVTVNGRDVTGIVVRMSAGSIVTGRVTFEGAPSGSPGAIEIVPAVVDPDRSLTASSPTRAEMHDDWTFQLAGISGPRRLRVTRAPTGWAVKHIFVNGSDVIDAILPFGTDRESLSDVEILLTRRVSEMAGAVFDARGQPCADCVVVAFATAREQWYPDSRFMRVAQVRNTGTFSIRGLPAADYYVVALRGLTESEREGDWQDPEFLDAIARSAARVPLSEGQTTSVAPPVIVR